MQETIIYTRYDRIKQNPKSRQQLIAPIFIAYNNIRFKTNTVFFDWIKIMP